LEKRKEREFQWQIWYLKVAITEVEWSSKLIRSLVVSVKSY